MIYLLNSHTIHVLLRIKLHDTLTNGLYALQSPSPQLFHVTTTSPDTWHARLVHCSPAVITSLCKSNVISSANLKFSVCANCTKAKAHQLLFFVSQNNATAPLQVIHTDLWGPTPIVSNNDHKYYVHFIDEFTRFSWFHTCASKDDVMSIC
jgi:GAG-pre-integrase domain